MKIIGVTGGVIDGSGDLILTKNEYAITLKDNKDVVIQNFFILGNRTSKLRASLSALKFIWLGASL